MFPLQRAKHIADVLRHTVCWWKGMEVSVDATVLHVGNSTRDFEPGWLKDVSFTLLPPFVPVSASFPALHLHHFFKITCSPLSHCSSTLLLCQEAYT